MRVIHLQWLRERSRLSKRLKVPAPRLKYASVRQVATAELALLAPAEEEGGEEEASWRPPARSLYVN